MTNLSWANKDPKAADKTLRKALDLAATPECLSLMSQNDLRVRSVLTVLFLGITHKQKH